MIKTATTSNRSACDGAPRLRRRFGQGLSAAEYFGRDSSRLRRRMCGEAVPRRKRKNIRGAPPLVRAQPEPGAEPLFISHRSGEAASLRMGAEGIVMSE